MLKIAICDDEKHFRENVKKCLEKYLINADIEFRIDTFSSGKEFIELEMEMVSYSLIFLDINMDEIDGIVTAQKIREYSSEPYIVFVTAYIKYSLEGYKVNAARYLLKNSINFDESLYECMDAILSKMNRDILRKTFKFNECEREVLIEHIVYIESKLHKLLFYIMEDKLVVYTKYGTLNEIEEEMQELRFLRIHQSYLVNLKHLKSISCYKAVLSNNQELMIPKARYRDVKNAYIAYKGEI